MAGSEQGGWTAARADLYQGAPYFLVPPTEASALARAKVEQLIRALGAQTIELSAAEHDARVARLSHLPHLVAAAVVRTAGSELSGVGGGFLDGTRVAVGDPQLWREILGWNREALLLALGDLQQELETAAAMLRAGRDQELQNWLAAAKDSRSRLKDFRGGRLS